MTGPIEVATFRQDASYSDGRHPDAVIFSTPEQDACRRDFTINGLFYDPLTDSVLDFVGGQEDLREGLIRAIGDPRERFAEDKLRLLRAVRLCRPLRIPDRSRHAPRHRGNGGRGPRSQHRTDCDGVAAHVAASRSSSGNRVARRGRFALSHFAGPRSGTRRGSAGCRCRLGDYARRLGQTDRSRLCLGVGRIGASLFFRGATSALASDLKLSTAETRRAAWLVGQYQNLLGCRNLPWPRLQRLLVSEGNLELLALAEAVAQATAADTAGIEHCRQQLALPTDELNPPPLITGDDLRCHGIPPGHEYQRLLEAVRDAQLEKSITSKAQALSLVDALRAVDRPPNSTG